MKRSAFCLSLPLLLIIVFSITASAQSLNWDVNLAKPFTFTSVNPVDDPGVTVDQMWYASIRDLMSLPTDPANDLYGILGSLNDKVNGFARVSVYLYNQDPPPPDADAPSTGRGPLIFQCYMDKTDDKPGFIADNPKSYDFGDWLAWWPDADENKGGFYFNDYWKSTDSRSAIMAAAFYNYNKKFIGWNTVESPGTAVIPYLNLPPNDFKLPVIIELTVYKANVTSLRLPGIGLVEPGYFKAPYLDIKAVTTSVYSNSVHVNIEIPTPESDDQINFSNININLSRFGDMSSTPLASQTIQVSQIPYTNNDLQLYIGKDPMPGEFWVWANYDISIVDKNGRKHDFPDQRQFLASYNINGVNAQFQHVYTVAKQDYKGLPVFTLSGGMSAEYGVEKSLASLSSGISETWNVRMINGKPDLKGGGPVSVYADANKFDFLDRAVKQTVQLYNDNLSATTPFNTVIIGTGIAHVPYLANSMKAPFLPLHFLVSIHSAAEVQRIVDTANANGYSVFSMCGYDSSIPDASLAWINLRELPPAYKQFLTDHKVQNVIIMGNEEGAGGQSGARRIWKEGQPDDDFAEGSMYTMGNAEEKTLKDLYKDYYRLNLGKEKRLIDWEGGIANIQFQNISTALKEAGITAYAIQAGDSYNFNQWATDIQMAVMVKNKVSPKMISMNEYLIGYPEYELYSGTVPYLYWQGGNTLKVAGNARDHIDIQVKPFYQGGQFKDIPVYFQAKYNRAPYVDAMKKYFTNVTQDNWQKADVWDPSDGMNSPCEVVAEAITKEPEGAKFFADWNNNRAVFNFDDFTNMIKNSIKPTPSDDPGLFPQPTKVSEVKKIADAGLTVTKYLYDPNIYWQPPSFPNAVVMRSTTNGYPGQVLGYLDGPARQPDIRKQMITIAQYDLANTSDEYDLRLGYKFNVTDKEGLLSYNPALGEEQKMDCFEYTTIPLTHWFDIPSRVMARSGAVWVVNGGVYDFDYNGLPGVVPFIKKMGIIKAQPQVLSFKGEAAFGWNWGKNKSVGILSRPKDIPATGIAAYLSTLFQDQTKNYPNVMGSLTFMTGKTGSGLYDIKALQPDWMKNYPPFDPYYLSRNNRCFFAPLSLNCVGTALVAPIEEGWNDCARLQNDDYIQRFSALAYQQYPHIFDEVVNARTYVALKGNKLDIGIIDGDFGDGGSYRGPYVTKTLGMHVYEESQFCLAKGYDQLVNLDGGSSTQMWLNGQGPLQMMNSYVLTNDNQGPYFSRLVSSFIMLVPKLHTELIRQNVMQANPGSIPIFDNTDINFNYSDATDLSKPKAFIDLSPCKDSLNKTDGSYGLIAGNFTMSQEDAGKNGGILFYTGEDMYYPDTKGLYTVHPNLRNLLVAGIGMVPPSLVDTLLKLSTSGTNGGLFKSYVISQKMSAYYIKVYNGVITDFIFEMDQQRGLSKYLFGDHRFLLQSNGPTGTNPNGQNIFFQIDGEDISLLENSITSYSNEKTGFLNIGVSTHAYIGALNLDGRFLTGNVAMKTYNYLFAVGKDAWTKVFDYTTKIDDALKQKTLPDLGDIYYQNGIYAVQCLETTGQHVFALAPKEQNRFYGLRLNNFIFKKTTPVKKPSKTKVK